jgi:hypothetical protein
MTSIIKYYEGIDSVAEVILRLAHEKLNTVDHGDQNEAFHRQPII